METTKNRAALDHFRFISALLIVGIHTSPLLSYSQTADFILTRIIARIAVPFFFMLTGYFLFSAGKVRESERIKEYLLKICKMYVIAILFYLPLNVYTGYFGENGWRGEVIKDIFFDGTFYHLWYLPASIMGVLIIAILLKKVSASKAVIISLLLYIIGLGGDSYYGLLTQVPIIKSFYEGMLHLSAYTRNGVFFAPIFLSLGAWIAQEGKPLSHRLTRLGFYLSSIFLLVEGLLLHNFNIQKHDSMYVMLLPCMYFLFRYLLQMNGKSNKKMRSISLSIYLVHPWIIVVLHAFAKAIHQTVIYQNSLIFFLMVSVVSFFAAWIWLQMKGREFRGSNMILTKIQRLGMRERFHQKVRDSEGKTSRAWIEINLEALKHNAKELQDTLWESCELMAVVKANAYGHGDIIVARTLNETGIQAFAVATLTEGIHLRKNGIRGEILILGYTPPRDINNLVRYKLTQTVIGYDYARSLNQMGRQVKVHIKVDTGMHRLGIESSAIAEIEEIFAYKNLKIEGMFTHLCVADSLKEEDVRFTRVQLERFTQTVTVLKEKGYSTGKLHVQSSYGILNYPNLSYDYARTGIALYGILSSTEMTQKYADLQPVLSIKARVVMVRKIEAHESVSYGRLFTANSNRRIATISIGYADGIPRNLFEGNASVLLHGKKAPIIGRICMDQLVVDVSEIKEVEPDDIATILGKDGEQVIRCEEFAQKCKTISNEILSRLSNRLEHVFHDIK